jgi:nicotinate phosphoribosyltransferase
MVRPGPVDVCAAPLSITDDYQLTMLAAYRAGGFAAEAVFEFFVRRLPPQRNFLVAAGLEQALDWLASATFTTAELDWLAASGRFDSHFLDWLAGWRFQGEVHALPEGTVFFADEPVLRVTAPIDQAQLVESRLINLLQLPILVASKAARCVLAASGRRLVDFGMRRAHGAEAALLAARASYLAGFDATATVEAGRRFGIPLSGTMAHSFVLAHDREVDAFTGFARCHPHNAVFLIDTFDTERGARRAVEAARLLATEGIALQAVRLDSGDVAALSKSVRGILDDAGFPAVRVFVSGNLDEHEIARLLDAGAPIDGFGVGTKLVTSEDAPYLECAYKLQQYAGTPRRKRSAGKATWPGAKQVFRRVDTAGQIEADVIGLAGEDLPGTPLLLPVMRGGERTAPVESLAAIRERCRAQLASLPGPLRSLAPAPAAFSAAVSAGVRRLAAEADARAG